MPVTDSKKDETTLSQYVCPQCLEGQLTENTDILQCQSCKSAFALDEGIPVFRIQPAEFKWGVSQQKVIDMLAEVDRVGWHDAMLDLCTRLPEKEAQTLWLRAFGLQRVALSMVLPLDSQTRVLDFGCGFGSISYHLAQRVDEVVAMDQIPLHLKWVRSMSEALGVKNIRYVQGGDTRYLPFPDNHFDAVVLNGVFEHLATNTVGDPKSVQERYLKEVLRILKPEGQVYIGIENRINYKYFRGVREGHISMKFGALLPRFLTRLYLKLARNQPFREYTYTIWGYRKLLRRAGFKHTQFYAPWPTYSSATRFFPVKETLKTDSWTVNSDHLAARWPGTYFVRAYSMVASVEKARQPLVDRILNHLSQQVGQSLPWELKQCVFYPTTGGKAFMDAETPDARLWKIQVGLTPYASERIEHQYQSVEKLRSQLKNSKLKALLPKDIYQGKELGYSFGMRNFVEGVSGKDLILKKSTRSELCLDAKKFLEALYAELGERKTMDTDLFDQHFYQPLMHVKSWFTENEWQEHKAWFDRAAAWLKKSVLGQEMLWVPFHGDYVPANCVWDPNHKALTQVVDWELYQAQGLPVLDWVCFLGDAHRSTIKEDLVKSGESAEQMRFHGHPFIFLKGELSQQVDEHLKALGLSPQLKEPLLFMWWVRQLVDWLPLHQYNPQWRSTRVFEFMRRWNQVWLKDDSNV